ncbi:MAG: hypothetical protein UX42_C0002G0005 [Microgenomates group bacterium GW2011_GWC1_46_20]|nr:MAG: hypothetical protein UX42_C0002G0005 [Microgenomates group bacterium GW2011_GWC1_46_20]
MKPVIATFKETLASLQDLKYGQIILQKSVGQALWYWTKYLLLIIAIGVILAIAALTYYAPQLPKILGDQIPDVDLTITSGIASTTVKQPFTAGDDKFIFILDTTGKLEDLDKYPAGVLILADKVVAKKDSADIRIYPLNWFGSPPELSNALSVWPIPSSSFSTLRFCRLSLVQSLSFRPTPKFLASSSSPCSFFTPSAGSGTYQQVNLPSQNNGIILFDSPS